MRPILIAGPTASGKSALALKISARTGAVVVNADAIQVYDCWRVLTARPSPEEEAAAPHALYGHVAASRSYSVGDWLREVETYLDGRAVVIVGGTGLYFSALTQGLAVIPPISNEVRSEGDSLRLAGLDVLQGALAATDPEIMARIDVANPARLQRAWEVMRQTGRSIAAWQAETGPALLPADQAVPVVLTSDTPWLNARIARRFGAMLGGGALEEAADWAARGLSFDLPSGKALGARELVAHLAGEMSLEAAQSAVEIATRQFAKRQRTWFRNRFGAWRSVPLDDATDLEALAEDLARAADRS